jgi:hypothetical protein
MLSAAADLKGDRRSPLHLFVVFVAFVVIVSAFTCGDAAGLRD